MRACVCMCEHACVRVCICEHACVCVCVVCMCEHACVYVCMQTILTCSTFLNTRNRFSPASFFRSACDQPRLAISVKRSGYLETSSRPLGTLGNRTMYQWLNMLYYFISCQLPAHQKTTSRRLQDALSMRLDRVLCERWASLRGVRAT